MGKAILKFKELEYLLRRAMPELKFRGWTKEGAVVEIPFYKLKAERVCWQDIELFKFDNFTIRKQDVEGEQDLQVLLKV